MSDSRAEFESIFTPKSEDGKYWMRRGKGGVYRNASIQSAWQGWDAAWNRRAQPERKPLWDLDSLQRYSVTINDCSEVKMGCNKAGAYVKFADVRNLLAAQPAAATVPDDAPPVILLTAQQYIDLNNAALLLEHMHEHGMADYIRAICDAAAISAIPAAQPTQDATFIDEGSMP